MITKAIFAAGGTGGHIFPAIAVADELKRLNKDVKIIFIGAKGRIEEKIIPKNGYELKTLEIMGFYRSISPKNFTVFTKFLKALKEAKKILKDFNPEIVYGTGGFVSGPVLMASHKIGIPSVIQEGNYYPGITVKWLSNNVNRVLINFEGSKKFFKKQINISVMPYPVRENLKKYSKKEACGFFGLDENKKTLFAFGGSQGANSINRALLSSLENLSKNNIQLIWQTGVNEFETINERLLNYNTIKPYRFIDNIDFAYSAADLIICRAGISTVMELASFGSAVLFVPYAFASENHQEKNARAMVDAGAAEMILDKYAADELFNSALRLLKDEQKLSTMKENIIRFADKNAASKTADLLMQIAENSKN
jgi:UDP-N-acetylglucosamine--N-acetylmuramyl-(pentapeptide) pyrophosphoryl-undecaprenol N-acetylglucosamine transferase